MGIRSVGTLAAKRRGGASAGAAASASGGSPGGALEAAVPTEVITLYTAIIAAVTASERTGNYLPFRVAVYILGLAATVWTTWPAISARIAAGKPQIRKPRVDAARSAELWTALLAFAAWGAVLPDSFLYAWLTGAALTLTVATIAATTAFVIAVVASPRLNAGVRPTPNGGPPTSSKPPTTPKPPGAVP